MRISDWSSDVCSSDLRGGIVVAPLGAALVDIDGAVALHDTLDCGNPAVVLQRHGDDGRSAAGRFGVTTGMLARSVAEDLVTDTADLVGHCCVFTRLFADHFHTRSAESRVGKECVCPCQSRWSPHL